MSNPGVNQEATKKGPTGVVNYARGLQWGVIFNLLTKVIALIAGLLIARTLGPEVMDGYWVVLSIYTFTDLFRESGLVSAYLNDSDHTQDRERAYNVVAIVAGCGTALAITALSWPIAEFFNAPELVFGCVMTGGVLLVNGFATIPSAKLLSQTRFKEVGIIETIAFLASYAVALALIGWGVGFPALMIQLVLCSLITAGLSAAYAKVGLVGFDRHSFRSIVRKGAAITAGNFLWLTYSLLDQPIVSKFFGVDWGGNYGAGKQLTSKPGDFLAVPLMRTIQVAIGHRAGDIDRLQRALGKAIIAFCLTVLPMFVCLAVLAEPFVLALLSSKFSSTIVLVPALCAYALVKVFGGLSGNIAVALGRSDVIIKCWVAGYVVAGAYFWLRSGSMEPVEIAWAFTGGMALVNLLILAFALSRVGVYGNTVPRLLQTLICTTLIGLASFGLLRIGLPNWTAVLVGLTVLPLLHAALVGTVCAGKPLAFFSKSGTRAFWEAL